MSTGGGASVLADGRRQATVVTHARGRRTAVNLGMNTTYVQPRRAARATPDSAVIVAATALGAAAIAVLCHILTTYAMTSRGAWEGTAELWAIGMMVLACWSTIGVVVSASICWRDRQSASQVGWRAMSLALAAAAVLTALFLDGAFWGSGSGAA